MEILEQSAVAANVVLSETEAKVLSMAVGYWKEAMDTNSPLVSGLTERLQAITDEFDAVLGDEEG
jgi:hypothetical protein